MDRCRLVAKADGEVARLDVAMQEPALVDMLQLRQEPLRQDEKGLGVEGAHCSNRRSTTRPSLGPLLGRFVTEFYRFFGLYWETSTINNLTPEDSRHSGSRRIEFSSKGTTF